MVSHRNDNLTNEVFEHETENLRYMWNRISPDVLSVYLRRTLNQAQPFFTRRKIVEYLASQYPGEDFLFEEKILNRIVRPYLAHRKSIDAWIPRANSLYQELFRLIGRVRLRRLRGARKPISLLDIGCGVGNYFEGVILSSRLDPFIDYMGLDLSEKVIRLCKSKYPKYRFPSASFNEGNILALDFPDQSFDVVMVNHVYEHLSPDVLERAVAETVRVTRSLGILNFFYEDDVPEHVITPRKRYHWNLLSRPRFRALLVAQGIEPLDIIVVDTYPPFARGRRLRKKNRIVNMPTRKSTLLFKKAGVNLQLSASLF